MTKEQTATRAPIAPDGPEADRAAANSYLATGVGVAAIGALGALVGGALCPVCLVATPALLGAGFYKAWRARRGRARAEGEESDVPTP